MKIIAIVLSLLGHLVVFMKERLSRINYTSLDYLQVEVKSLFSEISSHGEIRSRISSRCILDDSLIKAN